MQHASSCSASYAARGPLEVHFALRQSLRDLPDAWMTAVRRVWLRSFAPAGETLVQLAVLVPQTEPRERPYVLTAEPYYRYYRCENYPLEPGQLAAIAADYLWYPEWLMKDDFVEELPRYLEAVGRLKEFGG